MTNFSSKKVLIMSGYPGSGKSTLAKKIAKEYGYTYLSTDLIREELFNSDRFDKRGHDYIMKITKAIYEELYNRAVKLVTKGQKVIIDGTHLHTQKRLNSLKRILESIDSNQVAFVLVKVSPEIIKERMAEHSEQYNDDETMFEAWQRVFKIFVKDEKEGLITWPSESEGVAVILSKDIYEQLD